MSILNESLTPAAIAREARLHFFDSYDRAEKANWSDPVTGPAVQSNADHETYFGIEGPPQVHEFKDSLIPGMMHSLSMTINNLLFTTSLEVGSTLFEDQQNNAINRMTRRMGARVQAHKGVLAGRVLEAGETAKGVDGQNFFSAAHPGIDAFVANQSNLLTGSAYTFGSDGLAAAELAMYKITDAHGQLMGLTPQLVLVPPAKAGEARKLFGQERLASGESNPDRNRLQYIVGAHLTDDDNWYLIGEPGEGLIYQLRYAPRFFHVPPERSGNKNLLHLFYAKGRYNFGLGDWRAIIKLKP